MAYHSPFSLCQNFAKVCRQVSVTNSLHLVNPGKFTIKAAEGFNYDSFNPRGNPSVWSILKLVEMGRCVGSWIKPPNSQESFAGLADVDQMLYVVSLQFSCEPEMYEPAVEKQPVLVDNEMVHVGNTSFKIRTTLCFPKINKPVAKADIGMVFVDQETRRPSKPPGWWREKFSQYSRPNEQPAMVKPFAFGQRTGDIREQKVVVQSADLDSYCHVNNVSFIRYCYEAYIASHVGQFGYTGHGDPFRNVKNLDCVFKGEAGLGDLLKVCFVQDPHDGDTYHFQVVKDSLKNIFECSLHFFPQSFS